MHPPPAHNQPSDNSSASAHAKPQGADRYLSDAVGISGRQGSGNVLSSRRELNERPGHGFVGLSV